MTSLVCVYITIKKIADYLAFCTGILHVSIRIQGKSLYCFIFAFLMASTHIEKHLLLKKQFFPFNPTALRKAKIVCNFGLFECNRVKTPYLERAANRNLQQSFPFVKLVEKKNMEVCPFTLIGTASISVSRQTQRLHRLASEQTSKNCTYSGQAAHV